MNATVLMYLISWEWAARALGAAQLGMAVLGAALPLALGWGRELGELRPFYRRLFWTYAVYVFATNLFFGIALAFAPGTVLGGGPGGIAITIYLLGFWGGRLALELAGFDRDALPPSPLLRGLRAVLGVVLAAMVLGYAAVLWRLLG
jgi:hypothetical protein